MDLSVKTLFLTNVAVLFLSAGTAWYFWRPYRENAVLLWWSLGNASAGLAYLVFGFFSPAPPTAIAVAAITLFGAGCTMFWESARRFNGRQAALGRMALIVLAFAVVFGIALHSDARLRDRLSLFSLAIAILVALAAWEIMRGVKQEVLLSRLPVALVLGAMTVGMLARVAIMWTHPPGPATETFYDAMGALEPLANTIGFVCLNIGFVFMMSERLHGQYRKDAFTDALTDLPNQRFFLEQAEPLSRRARKAGTACLLMMDLDHFSAVNERFGHGGGDLALAAFAGLLRDQVPPTQIVARYGGKQFCAFLGGVEASEGMQIAEAIRAILASQAIDIRGEMLKLTVSIGVAALGDGDLGAAIRNAQDALHLAKAQGRDRVVLSERRLADAGDTPAVGFLSPARGRG
jgi:diguanylate cyclase (GGDEF)-like protein